MSPNPNPWRWPIALPVLLVWIGSLGFGGWVMAEEAPVPVYQPIALTPNQTLTDRLTVADIPTGEGTFSRDYGITLQGGDQVAIAVTSQAFDPLVMVIGADGVTLVANDDSPEGGTNALAFVRINRTERYIVRVQGVGVGAGGEFTLRLDQLRPVNPSQAPNASQP